MRKTWVAYKPCVCLSPCEWYPNNEQSYVYGLTISAKLNLPSTKVRHIIIIIIIIICTTDTVIENDYRIYLTLQQYANSLDNLFTTWWSMNMNTKYLKK